MNLKLDDQLDELDAYSKRISEASNEQWDDVKGELESSLQKMNHEREELTNITALNPLGW